MNLFSHKYQGRLLPILYILTFLPISSALAAPAFNVVADEDTVVKTLSEVTIQAKKEIHTDDGDIIFLSAKNRAFGTNALDAVSSLRQFMPEINGTSLKTVTQKEVFILINGRPATAVDLRGYTGKEIKKVTYYPVAPPRYADYTDGPLIDVTVKADTNYIQAFVSASNSLNVGYGTDQAVIRWADSLNLVRADYFIDYRNLRYRNSESYNYTGNPELSRDYRSSSSYKGHYQYGKLSWQNTAHGNMLYLSAMFSHNPADRNYDNYLSGGEKRPDLSGKESDVEKGDSYSRFISNLSDMGSLNFYFSRNLRKGSIEVQANGSIGRTTSENYLSDALTRYDSNSLRNNMYAAFGKVQYYLPIRKVNLFLTGSYQYQHTDHKQSLPEDLKYTSDNHNLSLTAAFTGRFIKESRWLSYSLGLRTERREMENEYSGIDLVNWRFTPYLTLSSLLSNRLFMRLTANIKTGIPSIGQLYDVPSFQEANMAWTGNPDLKGWTSYSISWQPEYWIILSRLSLNGDLSFVYTANPIESCVYAGNPVTVRYTNLSYRREGDAVLYINILPGGNFTIKPYLQWTLTRYRTPNLDLGRGYFRYGGTVTYNTTKVQAMVSLNAPYKSFNGDITTYGGWQLSASVLVRLPANLTASLGWAHSYQHDRTSVCAPEVLTYISKSHVPRLANQITLGLTWSFSHGIFKQRRQANVNDINTDSGISDFNRAKE